MTDSELINKILGGEKDLFRLIVERYQNLVFRTSFSLVHQKDDAEDITQEVFVKVYQSLKDFKQQASLSTWIYRISLNLSLNHIRNNKKSNWVQRLESFFDFSKMKESEIIPKESINPESILIAGEQSDILHKAIDLIPENQRIAFTLSKFDELSYKEIADVMKISIPSVESLIYRAKSNLQKNLLYFYKKNL